ncbi:MAG: hypothetical protein AAGK78_04420 [Planctomycetota bacterium]
MPDDLNYDPQKRIAYLEDEVARLRAQQGEADESGNVVAPWFNLKAFNSTLNRLGWVSQAIWPLFILGMFLAWWRPNLVLGHWIGPVPVFDVGGMTTGFYGIGVGLIAMGGMSIGVFAIGGLAVGVFAYGGGAIGLIAMGGGAVGLIAYGGGAVGIISLGGSAVGKYVLAQRGAGKYVLARNRQDMEAAEFFKRYIPGLEKAIGRPMPVTPLTAQTVGEPGRS